MTKVISIVTPTGSKNSTCGYCPSRPGGRSEARSSYTTAGLIARQISCEVYQKMVDRGWRRSGTYFYKPNLGRSCCPCYTIKLSTLEFNASKSQRKLINRWNRYVLYGNATEAGAIDNTKGSVKSKGKEACPSFSLAQSIHASERVFLSDQQPARNFQTTLEPSVFTLEKYALYNRYQTDIHHDDDNTSSDFKRFLVDSPLLNEPIPYTSTPPEHLPSTYGSYHQMYRIDGQLIAMAVLDILPNCVSSVYFMYDKTWEKYSLGKLSALREASLAKEMHDAGATDMASLYMGFYIHSCQKMRYKGDYSPSFLLDPEEYTWHPLKDCVPLLDKYRYACFAHADRSLEGSKDPGPDAAPKVPDHMLLDINIVDSIQNSRVIIIPVTTSKSWKQQYFRDEVYTCIHGLGTELSKEVILCF